MSEEKRTRKRGSGLIAFGIVIMLFSGYHFYQASQVKTAAEAEYRINPARGNLMQDKANFKRMFGIIHVVGGAAACIAGVVIKRKNNSDQNPS